MQIFTVSFFGHRYLESYNEEEQRLYSLICKLINSYPYVDFLVGRDGEFDLLVASCVRKAKKEIFDANSSLIWVQPYQKADYIREPDCFENYYDEIEICDASAAAYPKAAIQIRNRAMVDRSDLCVFFVSHSSGGAWQTLCYAKKQNKRMMNLFDNTRTSEFH